ncbi:MAG: guanylate kinase [Bdellovibrionota bacterium]
MGKGHKRDFIAMAAPSGGGKTTLCRMLLAKYPTTALSISFTTRAPRGNEKNGVDYHFVDQARFDELIRNDELVEWAEVHGQRYGTSKAFLETQVKAGKAVLLDIDVQGVESLKRCFGNRCISIFILPPSMPELEQRLRSRKTESEEKLKARLDAARIELEHAKKFDHQIVNSDLQKSFGELCELVEREVGLVSG